MNMDSYHMLDEHYLRYADATIAYNASLRSRIGTSPPQSNVSPDLEHLGELEREAADHYRAELGSKLLAEQVAIQLPFATRARCFVRLRFLMHAAVLCDPSSKLSEALCTVLSELLISYSNYPAWIWSVPRDYALDECLYAMWGHPLSDEQLSPLLRRMLTSEALVDDSALIVSAHYKALRLLKKIASPAALSTIEFARTHAIPDVATLADILSSERE